MEKLWEPPSGELIISAQNYLGKIVIFTDKGVYGVAFPIPWYKKLWRKIFA